MNSTFPNSAVVPLRWQDDALWVLDQRLLPAEVRYLRLTSAPQVADAIAAMAVRGAPAIGIAAAYGIALAAQEPGGARPARLEQAFECLAASRPTAVNLAWALARMRTVLVAAENPGAAALAAAHAIHDEDRQACGAMAEHGAAYLRPGSGVLTHCNTGALATGGIGTALGVIRAAHAAGHLAQVYMDETRPWLQGARLTAWELAQDGIPAQLIVDGAAAWLFAQRQVHWLIVGADRIAANGDVANKIGTYGAALAARAHGARVMVVAPVSSFDPAVSEGAQIVIEERPAGELTTLAGVAVAPPGTEAWNPVFDVTPAGLIDVIVTEYGAIDHPDTAAVAAHLAAAAGRGGMIESRVP